MRRIRILEAASEEAEAAAAWYEHQRAGLGAEFEHAIEAVLDLLELDIFPCSPCRAPPPIRGSSV